MFQQNWLVTLPFPEAGLGDMVAGGLVGGFQKRVPVALKKMVLAIPDYSNGRTHMNDIQGKVVTRREFIKAGAAAGMSGLFGGCTNMDRDRKSVV